MDLDVLRTLISKRVVGGHRHEKSPKRFIWGKSECHSRVVAEDERERWVRNRPVANISDKLDRKELRAEYQKPKTVIVNRPDTENTPTEGRQHEMAVTKQTEKGVMA